MKALPKTKELIRELMKSPQLNRFIKNSDHDVIASMSAVCNLTLLEEGEEAIVTIMANWVTLGMNQKIDRKTIEKNAKDKHTDFMLHYKMFVASNQTFAYRVRRSITRIYRAKMIDVDPVESLMHSSELHTLYLLLLLAGKMYFMSRAQ
jgi:hypothetical protein